MKRMARNHRRIASLSLTSLMDVFTILVFFLLVNSANTEVLETPKQITLPASVIEQKPRETVVVFISPEAVMVQGEVVIATAEILGIPGQTVPPLGARLAKVAESVIGASTRAVANSQEVTILADRSVPFSVVKKVMSTCTGEGYGKISLAVLQKASQTASRGAAKNNAG